MMTEPPISGNPTLAERIREAAMAAHDAGLAPFPTTNDGDKRPESATFSDVTSLSRHDVRELFAPDRDGLGLLTGPISGNLEALDFDLDPVQTWQDFAYLCGEAGLGELLTRIYHGYSEKTPSGGQHILYRVLDGETKSKKLAMNGLKGALSKAYIEVKGGANSFIIVSPSGGRVHPDGGSWRIEYGSFATIVTITGEERDALHAVAAQIDRRPVKLASGSTAPVYNEGESPWAAYEEQGDWHKLLAKHGFDLVYTRDASDGVRDYYRRPGKTRGVSCSVCHTTNRMAMYSTSTEFDIEGTHSLPWAFTVLECDGDKSNATKRLLEDGYGSRRASMKSMADHVKDYDTKAALQKAVRELDKGKPAPDLIGDEIAALMGEEPSPGKKVDWEMISVSDALADRDPQYSIKGVIPEEALVYLYGPPGSMKTMFALDMCAHIALGRDWNGRRTRQGGAIYIASEGRTGIKGRLEAINAEFTDDDGFSSIPREMMLSTVRALRVLDPEEVLTFLQHIVEVRLPEMAGFGGRAEDGRLETPLRLIVLDTLTASLAGQASSNDEEAIGAVEEALRTMGRKIGEAQGVIPAIMVVHHTGKDASKGARGSSAILGNADTVLLVSKSEALELSNRVFTMTPDKVKDGPDAWKIEKGGAAVYLDEDEDGEDIHAPILTEAPSEHTSGPKPRTASPFAATLSGLFKSLKLIRGNGIRVSEQVLRESGFLAEMTTYGWGNYPPGSDIPVIEGLSRDDLKQHFLGSSAATNRDKQRQFREGLNAACQLQRPEQAIFWSKNDVIWLDPRSAKNIRGGEK